MNRTPGPAGLNLKSDLNSTALRPCSGYRSCPWSQQIAWEKPGRRQWRRAWAQGQLGIGRLRRNPASCRVSTPWGPPRAGVPSSDCGQDEPRPPGQVRRSGLRTKWTANISCGDDKTRFFFLEQQELSWWSRGWESMFPTREAWVQPLVRGRLGPDCCNQDRAQHNKWFLITLKNVLNKKATKQPRPGQAAVNVRSGLTSETAKGKRYQLPCDTLQGTYILGGKELKF